VIPERARRTGPSPLRLFYLGLALCGLVPTLIWGSPLWRAGEVVPASFWSAAIAATALSVWVVAETRVRRNWIALCAIPVAFFVGIGAGLPLYLFLRTRPVS